MPTEKIPTTNSKRLGEKIRKAREAKGVSVREFSETAGVAFSTLSRLESGLIYRPSTKILQRLSRALDIPLDELYVLAGYAHKEGLPSLPVYLRSKFGLSAAEASELEEHFRRINERRKKGGKDEKKRTT